MVKDLPANTGDGFDPWSVGTLPLWGNQAGAHNLGRPPEPVLCNKRNRTDEGPAQPRDSPHAATRESLRSKRLSTANKTKPQINICIAYLHIPSTYYTSHMLCRGSACLCSLGSSIFLLTSSLSVLLPKNEGQGQITWSINHHDCLTGPYTPRNPSWLLCVKYNGKSPILPLSLLWLTLSWYTFHIFQFQLSSDSASNSCNSLLTLLLTSWLSKSVPTENL